MGLFTTPRWMAMRNGEASFILAHGRIELRSSVTMRAGLTPGGVWMGRPGGYSLSALHGHGKGALVLIAWELGTVAW